MLPIIYIKSPQKIARVEMNSEKLILTLIQGSCLQQVKFSTPQFAGRVHLPTFTNLIAYLRNQAQQPQCADFSLSFITSLSPLHSSPGSVCLARSHGAAAQHRPCAPSLGSSLGCSAAFKAAVLKNHHANEKKKKKSSCWDRISK